MYHLKDLGLVSSKQQFTLFLAALLVTMAAGCAPVSGKKTYPTHTRQLNLGDPSPSPSVAPTSPPIAAPSPSPTPDQSEAIALEKKLLGYSSIETKNELGFHLERGFDCGAELQISAADSKRIATLSGSKLDTSNWDGECSIVAKGSNGKLSFLQYTCNHVANDGTFLSVRDLGKNFEVEYRLVKNVNQGFPPAKKWTMKKSRCVIGSGTSSSSPSPSPTPDFGSGSTRFD